jgi:ectoine hydroxylase-related dioxygenase (phytanoyl-CoA dioxygenase family)
MSNGYPLENKPEIIGWLSPTDPATSTNKLRERYDQDGYLWLKGILHREEVLDFRRRYFQAFADTGLLAANSDPVAGIYSGNSYNKEAVHKLMLEVVRWAEYEAFCLAKPILKFYEAFFDSPVYLHKRKLIRFNRPGEQAATGAHYDQIYLRDGTDRFCSSWIPIGDTDVEMGGLIYLEESPELGRKIEAEYLKKTTNLPHSQRVSAYDGGQWNGWLFEDLANVARQSGKRWLLANYEAGDMVVHSPYILHAALTNQDSQSRMRLSTDIRYQRVAEPIDRRWANHWSPDDNL